MPGLKKYQKGLKRELAHSLKIHSKQTPLLISALTARAHQVGQVDLAVLAKKGIRVYEVKHPDSYGLLPAQYNRLKRSVEWLAKLFDSKISFEVLS